MLTTRVVENLGELNQKSRQGDEVVLVEGREGIADEQRVSTPPGLRNRPFTGLILLTHV